MYRVVLTNTAKKDLRKVDQKYKQRIQVALVSLQKDPLRGKRLGGKWKHHYSMRVWPYRILYKYEKKKVAVYVIRIGHRQGVY